MNDEYYSTHKFSYWHCSKCGRRYHSLENYCMFCSKKNNVAKSIKHIYVDKGERNLGQRTFYLRDIDLTGY